MSKNIAMSTFISIKQANICSLFFLITEIVIAMVLIRSWEICWTKEYILRNIVNLKTVILYFLFVISIPIHECIHAFFFFIFSKDSKKIKIGFDKSSMTPYCSCSVPIPLWQYIIVMIMPSILLGFMPGTFAIVNHNILWLFWGIIEVSCAGADLFIVFLALFNGEYKKRVLDHPSQVGYISIN